MKIKNLKVFKSLDKEENYDTKKNFKLKLTALLLSGFMFLPTIGGCSSKVSIDEVKDDAQYEEELQTNEEKVFQPGEHVMVDDYVNYEKGLNQIVTHDGYEVFDIQNISHTDFFDVFYVNKVPVTCKATSYDSKTHEFLYEDFGTPLEKEKIYTK